jgi:hypothetical protein
MRNHVGGHILCSLWDVTDTKIKFFWKQKELGTIPENVENPKLVGENPCRFCGLDGCLTSIVEKKSGNSVKVKISSNCPYHYEHMQYNKVAISTLLNCHVPMCQFNVPCVPHLSQEIHRPFGNTMVCTI